MPCSTRSPDGTGRQIRCASGLGSKADSGGGGDRPGNPQVILARRLAGRSQLLEMFHVRRPGWIRAMHDVPAFFRRSAGNPTAPNYEFALPPLGQAIHLQRPLFSRHLDPPAILPGYEAAFHDHAAVGSREDAVVEPLELVAAPLPHVELAPELSEEEPSQIHEMTGHILEHSVSTVAPGTRDIC